MTRKYFICCMSIALCCLVVTDQSSAQDDLATSSTWFAQALREWFPQEITIYGANISINRIRGSNTDLTHFDAEAGKSNIGSEPAFHIKGTITIDPLPPGFKVADHDKGNKYKLSLQAYLFSPEGTLLWSERGFLSENPLVSIAGLTTSFHLKSVYSGPINGCTAAILAIGDSLVVNDTRKTLVILGMKRFSFQESSTSTGYEPAKGHASKKLAEADSNDTRAKESQDSAESKVISGPDSTLSLVYTVQAGSFNDLDSARKLYDSILNKLNKEDLAYLRIEKVGQHYAVRIGKFGEQKHAKKFHEKTGSHLSASRVMKAYIKKERIIKLYSL